MSVYRCLFSDRAGMPVGWKAIQSNSDAHARKMALALLRERSDVRRLEAWREADLAFRLSRFDVDIP